MLKPGVQRGGSLASLSYAVDNGGMAINGARVNDTLITFDGAVGIRSRGNNTSNGVAEVVQHLRGLIWQLRSDEIPLDYARLAADLESGAWHERHRDLFERESLDVGYRLVVAEQHR